MAIESTAAGIGLRFYEEQDYIQRYVNFLLAKSTIHDHLIQDLNRILTRFGIEPLPTRHYERTSQPFSREEIGALLAGMCNAGLYVDQAIDDNAPRPDEVPAFLLSGPAADYPHLVDEWIQYFLNHVSDDPKPGEIEAITRNALSEAEANDKEAPLDVHRILIRDAIEHVRRIRAQQRLDALQYTQDQFEDLEIRARVMRPDAEINLLRQGFILLMTAFDAAVFDLVRVKLRKDFFTLIRAFGKNEKVTLQEIGDAGSFEAFRDQIIDDQLKAHYLKDLLFLLQSIGVSCIEETGGDQFMHLIELVLRRNVHVHNRGIVDERYLECDLNGKQKYNLYNLNLGDVAPINESHWDWANRLCRQCVNNVADWANA